MNSPLKITTMISSQLTVPWLLKEAGGTGNAIMRISMVGIMEGSIHLTPTVSAGLHLEDCSIR